MICPYCEVQEINCIPAVVYSHTHAYGGGIKRFDCLNCGKVVKVVTVITAIVSKAEKTDKPSDW